MTATFSNNGTPRMQIDANGNVGIGTLSGGPFGVPGTRGTITLVDGDTTATMTASDLASLKELVELIQYLASADPVFNEKLVAFKAKKRILK
jgi:hypothetical protein